MARVWLSYLLKIVIFHGFLHVYQRVREHYGKVMENRGEDSCFRVLILFGGVLLNHLDLSA